MKPIAGREARTSHRGSGIAAPRALAEKGHAGLGIGHTGPLADRREMGTVPRCDSNQGDSQGALFRLAW